VVVPAREDPNAALKFGFSQEANDDDFEPFDDAEDFGDIYGDDGGDY
jgi:hypothetical protein